MSPSPQAFRTRSSDIHQRQKSLVVHTQGHAALPQSRAIWQRHVAKNTKGYKLCSQQIHKNSLQEQIHNLYTQRKTTAGTCPRGMLQPHVFLCASRDLLKFSLRDVLHESKLNKIRATCRGDKISARFVLHKFKRIRFTHGETCR